MSVKPEFEPGDTLNIVRYLPPLPKGATVMVKRIEFRGENYQYVVEGRRTPDGETIEVWADEADLKPPLVFEEPRKKRRGSIAYELQTSLGIPVGVSAVPVSTSVTAMPASGASRLPVAAAEEPRKRRRRKSDETIGIIPTRTGRSGRSRDIESLLFAERPKTNGNRSSPAIATPPTPAIDGTTRTAGRRTARSKPADPVPTDKRGRREKPIAPAKSEAPAARRKRSSGSASESAGKSGKAPRKRSVKAAKNASTISGIKVAKPARALNPAKAAPAIPAGKPAKPPARRKRSTKQSATTKAGAQTKRAAAGARAPKAAVTGRGAGFRSRVESQPETGPGIPDQVQPKRRRKAEQQSNQSVGMILDGILGGQTFPGGMVLGGGTGAPIIILIVNISTTAEPVATATSGSVRKRRGS